MRTKKLKIKLVPGGWSSHVEYLKSGDIFSVTFQVRNFNSHFRHSTITWLPPGKSPGWCLTFAELAKVLKAAQPKPRKKK